MRTALTIAGSDSSGRAGIQADLRTFAQIGVRGTTAITAITAQNAHGITTIAPLEADLVTAQIEAVMSDGVSTGRAAATAVHATKIGMLANAAIAEAVVAAIEDLELPLVVLDPVLASSTGTRLLDADGVQVLLAELLPRVLVVTPNVPEAEALSGKRITSLDDVREAARRLHRFGAANVIVKGGHLPGTEVVDVLFDGKAFHESRTARAERAAARGTGCSFASAVAAFLALGHALPDAAQRAQRHVAALLASAQDVY
jgi:hydroxymethylpyrimidine/phosphomethylpyrimidine kinase